MNVIAKLLFLTGGLTLASEAMACDAFEAQAVAKSFLSQLAKDKNVSSVQVGFVGSSSSEPGYIIPFSLFNEGRLNVGYVRVSYQCNREGYAWGSATEIPAAR